MFIIVILYVLCLGLFVSFCHSFDQMAKTPYRIYFVASTIGKNAIVNDNTGPATLCSLAVNFASFVVISEPRLSNSSSLFSCGNQ